jgi:hypothetical protein
VHRFDVNIQLRQYVTTIEPLLWILNEDNKVPAKVANMTQKQILRLTSTKINPILIHYGLPVQLTLQEKRSSLLQFLGKYK